MCLGKLFVVFGDFINVLDFSVGIVVVLVDMGGMFMVKVGDKVMIIICFKSFDYNNYEYLLGSGFKVNMCLVVDYVDLIVGDVMGKVVFGMFVYVKDINDFIKVIVMFIKVDWKVDVDGYNSIMYIYMVVKNQYFCLCGINFGMNVLGEISNGNLLFDQKIVVMENVVCFNVINDCNYNDLWFYLNLVFVLV